MSKQASILVVDDEPEILNTFRRRRQYRPGRTNLRRLRHAQRSHPLRCRRLRRPIGQHRPENHEIRHRRLIYLELIAQCTPRY